MWFRLYRAVQINGWYYGMFTFPLVLFLNDKTKPLAAERESLEQFLGKVFSFRFIIFRWGSVLNTHAEIACFSRNENVCSQLYGLGLLDLLCQLTNGNKLSTPHSSVIIYLHAVLLLFFFWGTRKDLIAYYHLITSRVDQDGLLWVHFALG